MESSRHSNVAKRMTFMIDDILRIERASKSSSSSSHAPHSTAKQYASGLRGHDDFSVTGERDDSRYKATSAEVAYNDVSPSDGAKQYRGKCPEGIQQDGGKVSKLTSGSRCSRTQSSSRKETFPVDAPPVEKTASWFGPSGQTGEMPCSDESSPNDLSSYRCVADRSPVSAAAAAAALFRLCHAHRMQSAATRDRDDIVGQSPAVDASTATRGFWSTLLVPNPSESPAVSPSASQSFRHPVASFSSSLPPFPFPLMNFARSAESHVTAAMAAAAAMTNAVPGVMIRGDVTAGVGSGVEHFLRLKCRRNRTVFSEFHLTSLEKNFDRQKYLSTKDRAQLAARLGLSQIQVKTWYQNRRMKWKKQVIQQGGTQPPTKPKGRPRKHEEDQEQTEDQLCDIKEL